MTTTRTILAAGKGFDAARSFPSVDLIRHTVCVWEPRLGAFVVPAAAQEKLLFATLGPPDNRDEEVFKPWVDAVNRDAKGSIVVEERFGFSITNFPNVLDRVNDNVGQIGWTIQSAARKIAGRSSRRASDI